MTKYCPLSKWDVNGNMTGECTGVKCALWKEKMIYYPDYTKDKDEGHCGLIK